MTSKITTPDKVTILLSTYNGSRYLQPQLDSLYRQTYPNIRILVRDDCSSDSTRSILASEQAKGRLEILEGQNNLGLALSFFELLRNAALSDTEYVAFCDQDDVWHSEKIARAIERLVAVADSCPAMYCSRAELVDENLEHIGYTALPGKIGFGNALVDSIAAGCTMVLNRNAVNLIGENLPGKAAVHDWWCYLVVSCFGKVIFDEAATLKYRQHGANSIGVPGGFVRFVRKCRRFFGGGGGYLWMSEQALFFRNIFKDRIPAHNRQVLNIFVAAKSSLYRRIQLAFSREIWRQTWLDNLLLRILILLNRY